MAERQPHSEDSWNEGTDYDQFMGRWSRLVAARFVADLAIPAHKRWLDVGCGTGALLGAILEAAEPSFLAGIDPSTDFVTAASEATDGRADVRTAFGEDLPFGDDEFDVVVSGIALNFMPDPVAALQEWRRVAAPGATISVYLWDYGGGMEFLRSFWDIASDLDPFAESLDEGVRFPLCQPEPLASAFVSAGMAHPTIGSIEVPTVFADFNDYWLPFTHGQGPAPGYVTDLPPDARERLRSALRDSLEADQEGRIHMQARAWTASATS
ncbi:MAG: class I SAM-dependent methyltransferase [Acidimicrobiia bacterium]